MALIIKPITAAQLQQVVVKLSAIEGVTMTETAPDDFTITSVLHDMSATAAFDPNEEKLTVILVKNDRFIAYMAEGEIKRWIEGAMKN